MHIVLTNYLYKPHFGGVENSLFHIGEVLKQKGHSVTLLLSDRGIKAGDRLPMFEENESVNIYRYRSHQSKMKLFNFFSPLIEASRVRKRFRQIHSEKKVDLILSRDYRSCYGLIPVKEEYSIPLVYIIPGIVKYQDASGSGLESASLKSRLKSLYRNHMVYKLHGWMQKKSVREVSLNILFSENMRKQLYAVMHWDNAELDEEPEIVPPGVEAVRFVGSDNSSRLRKEMGFDEDAFILLCLGRVIPAKGMDIAIRALKYIRHPKARLLIVGGGSGLQDLKNMVKELEIEHKVVFTGISEEPEKYYQLADLFLMTSRYEPFGQTILEAMATGLPVVAFNSYDNPDLKTASSEIIKDGENGFLCSFGVQSLAEKINEISGEADSKLVEVGANARKKVLENYNWDSFTGKVLSLINKSGS